MHKMHEQKRWIIWCPHLLHKVFEMWPLLTPNWRHSPHPIKKQPNWGEAPNCIRCHELLLHIHPCLQHQIGAGRNVLQRHHKIASIMNWYNVSPTITRWTLVEGLVMVNMPQEHVQFDVGCNLVQYGNKVETIVGIHLQKIMGENSPKSVQKPSQNDHLQINVTCFGMSIWKKKKKV